MKMMRVGLILSVVLALGSAASAQPGTERSTAILVSPIHEAQVVHGDDGMDHVEYELLVINVFASPVTLTSVAVLDLAGKEFTRIEGDPLNAATQTLLARTETPAIPASGVVSVDVDLVLPPGTAPERVTHKIAYALEPDAPAASVIGSLVVDGPEVTVNRAPAVVLKPPLAGKGWWTANGCCLPNIHRDTRVAINGQRIATPETFAIDFARFEDGKVFAGDGKKVDQHYAFGAEILAVADGTVVSIRDGMPEETPFQAVKAVHAPEDYAGNHLIIELAPKLYAAYAHLQPGSLTVKVGDRVTAGTVLARLGNTGNSSAPHLHFGLLDKADFLAGESIPFVFERFMLAGAVDVSVSDQDSIKIVPDSRAVESAYPLYPGIADYP